MRSLSDRDVSLLAAALLRKMREQGASLHEEQAVQQLQNGVPEEPQPDPQTQMEPVSDKAPQPSKTTKGGPERSACERPL